MNRYFGLTDWLCAIIVVIYACCIVGDIIKKKYKGFDFISSLVIFILTILVTFVISPAFVIGESMSPTLHDKQVLMLNKVDRDFETNDIVVAYSPNIKKKIIKRIVAVEGDVVSMQQGQLYVNGKEANEPYGTEPTFEDFPEIIVPEGSYFLMGDNRANSLDSRYANIGCVPKKYILGKAHDLQK